MSIRANVGLLVALVLALAGCGGSGGGGGGASNSPGDAAKGFILAMAKGDVEATKKFMHPEDVKGLGGQMLGVLVPAMAKEAEEMGGIEKVEVGKIEKIDDTHSTVTITVKFKKSEAQTDEVKVVKYQGKWYVGEGGQPEQRDEPKKTAEDPADEDEGN